MEGNTNHHHRRHHRQHHVTLIMCTLHRLALGRLASFYFWKHPNLYSISLTVRQVLRQKQT